mgnify:CR=1 FL=1
MYKNNWHCDFLHSHTRQQMFKVLEQIGKVILLVLRILESIQLNTEDVQDHLNLRILKEIRMKLSLLT